MMYMGRLCSFSGDVAVNRWFEKTLELIPFDF